MNQPSRNQKFTYEWLTVLLVRYWQALVSACTLVGDSPPVL